MFLFVIFTDSENLAKQLSNMLENQKIESVKPKENLSKEEKERKAAILAQYGHVSDEEYPFIVSMLSCV